MRAVPMLWLALIWSSATPAAAEPPTAPPRLSTTDVRGVVHDLGRNDAGRVKAFVFLSPECPISNAYTPTLNDLRRRMVRSDPPVELWGIVSDPTTTRGAARAHFAEYRAEFPVLFDASGLLFDTLRPTHVPEAFVFDRDDRLRYRGAIDNAWEALGRRRPTAEKAYLEAALTAIVGGKEVEVPRTPPVGCLPATRPEGPAGGAVTYARDIAPLMQARCVICHRAGQVAPFALETYEQVAKRADQLVQATRDRQMPPWIPAPSHERFVGERRLSDRELELLKTWAATGRPRGDDADLPPPADFPTGWHLGEPDLVVRMPAPFAVPADGPDPLQNFVIPIDLPEDALVAAVEFRPGNPRVVHHAVLFLDESGTARKLDRTTPEPGYPNFGGPGFLPSGALGGWSVGNTPRPLPNGMGRYLKKGSDLVVQVHYHPTGKPEVDRSEIGLYFVRRPVAESLRMPAKLVGSIWLSNYELDIPAGDSAYRRTASYVLPHPAIMVGIVPHMHLLGKSFRSRAILPDGTAKTLVDIPVWNYDRQDEYYYERPFELPAGTRLEVEAIFDNSAANPSNPSAPPRRVRWGDGTRDEMLFCFFLLSAEKTENLVRIVFDNLAHDARLPRNPPVEQPRNAKPEPPRNPPEPRP